MKHRRSLMTPLLTALLFTAGAQGRAAAQEPTCPVPVEVVVYTQSAWNPLADALGADSSPCADYFISIPALTADKTMPRSGAPSEIHAHGGRFHAMAEFQFASWSQVTILSPFEKGVEFRRRMEAAGYDVAAGDIWALNELPSTVRSNPAVRADAREILRGLYQGPPGAMPVAGTVFTVGLGQNTVNFAVYKPNLKNWITDQPFWVDMDQYARFWAQEVYADPHYVCLGSADLFTRALRLNQYLEHVPNLAAAGPDAAAPARSYFERAFVPLASAVWQSTGGYGDTRVPLDDMAGHIATQIYATRTFSDQHPFPAGRLGFGWGRLTNVSPDDLSTLAARAASSIHYAYDDGGGFAAGACSPTGDEAGCACDVTNAGLNAGWQTFESW